MGFVSGLLGGGSGAGFKAQSANLVSPVTKDQAEAAQTGSLNALTQQQAFLQALQAQNGLQNQTNVYNQLANVAAGQGPNPAQAMLANAAGQNVANQAALMASQRGASANPGLIARQAARQGAGIQQNAAGQAAALQAQQSLNALAGMGNLATQQAVQQQQATAGQTAAQQQQQQILLNSINAQNQANVSNASQQNQANANVAAVNAKNQAAGLGGLLNAAGPMLSDVGDWLGEGLSGLGGVLGTGASEMLPAVGGAAEEIAPYAAMAAEGGEIKKPGPKSAFGQMLMAGGGKVPALLSPGEKYLSPQAVQQVRQGANPMSVGKTVPGKPAVPGAKNDYKNDTVEADLEEGGIVIPRSATKSKNPDAKSAAFVQAVLAKKGKAVPKRG